jgi:hypothetical protein
MLNKMTTLKRHGKCGVAWLGVGVNCECTLSRQPHTSHVAPLFFQDRLGSREKQLKKIHVEKSHMRELVLGRYNVAKISCGIRAANISR